MTDSPAVQYVVDRALVEEEIARTRARMSRGRGRWFVRSFLRAAIALYVITGVAQWTQGTSFASLPVPKRFALVVFPALAALAIASFGLRQPDANTLDPDRRARAIASDLRALGGSGWALRSLRSGVFLGAVIGIPVGLLLTASWDPARFPVSNRWMVVPSFVGVTMLWTIPLAFLLRWVTLLALKRFIKPVAGQTH